MSAVPVPSLATLVAAAVAQPGFGGRLSVFESAGAPAGRVQALAWALVVVGALVTVLVVAATLAAALRRRGEHG